MTWFRKRKKVLLAIPVHSLIENDTVKSLNQMEIPKGVDVEFNYCSGYTVGLARNAIATYALNGKFDYVLWIDADMVVPKNLLTKLLSIVKENEGCGLATGYYIKKQIGEPIAELFKKGEGDRLGNMLEKDLPKDSIMEIDACGMGCCLTPCDMLKTIRDKYGMTFEYVTNKDCILSEDLNYCMKLQNEGKKLLADTSLRCGHVGKVVF